MKWFTTAMYHIRGLMNNTSSNNRWLIIAAFAAVYLVWGSSYIGIRFAIETIPPFLMTAVRFSSRAAF